MKKIIAIICSLQLLIGVNFTYAGLGALPSGEQVISGTVTFDSSNPSILNITNTNGAIIHWSDFSISEGNTVNFIQASNSAVLNRVTGEAPSSIYGTLNSNGHVYLINPNGIIIGQSGVINTASFIASTLDVVNSEFQARGNLNFIGNSSAYIENLGTITALDGDVVLVARTIDNYGNISAENGTAALLAGQNVVVPVSGNAYVNVGSDVEDEALIINNQGTIEAAQVMLNAKGGNIYALAINNEGEVRATGTETRNGVVYFVADGVVNITGTVESVAGTGVSGSINIEGGKVFIDGSGLEGDPILSATNDISISGNAQDIGGAGVVISDSVIESSGSDILIDGIAGEYIEDECYECEPTNDTPVGVVMVYSSLATSGSGGIKIDGTGGTGDSEMFGILASASQLITDGGDIILIGNGGESVEADTSNNAGVFLYEVDILSNDGSINISGFGGNGDSYNEGILIAESDIVTQTGNIDLYGIASGTGANAGLTLDQYALVQTNSGVIIIEGTGSGNGISEGVGHSHGIYIGYGVDVYNHGSGDIILNGLASADSAESYDVFLINNSNLDTVGGLDEQSNITHSGNIQISANKIYNDEYSGHNIVTNGAVVITSRDENLLP